MSEIRVNADQSVSTGVTGYKLYWGPAAGVYTSVGSPKDLGFNVSGGVVRGAFDILETQVLHIAMTAYNATLESAFSTELVGTVVLGCVTGRAN